MTKEEGITRKSTPKIFATKNEEVSFSTEFNQDPSHVKVENIGKTKKRSRLLFWLCLFLGLAIAGFYHWYENGNGDQFLKNNFLIFENSPIEVVPADTLLQEKDTLSNLKK